MNNKNIAITVLGMGLVVSAFSLSEWSGNPPEVSIKDCMKQKSVQAVLNGTVSTDNLQQVATDIATQCVMQQPSSAMASTATAQNNMIASEVNADNINMAVNLLKEAMQNKNN